MQKLLTYILSVLMLFGCTAKHRNSDDRKAIAVSTTIVQSYALSTVNRYVGTVEAAHETPLSMQTAGRVLSVNCKDGDLVSRGQVLLRVDDTQAVNALRSAEAALRYAEDGYNRLKQVYASGAVTDQKMVETESRLAQARSMYEIAQRQVNECELSAPCDGVVSGLDIAVGQTVAPGLRLLTLLDINAFCIKFTVPEAEIGNISIGQQGTMECAAVQRDYIVNVTGKGLKANPLSHTYEVTASIDGGRDELRSGMVGKVQLPTTNYQRPTTNLVIPPHCIQMMPQGPTVWLVRNGQAERVMVSVGGYRSDGVLINDGLAEGDTLITEGYQKLYKGCKINLSSNDQRLTTND